MFWRRHFAKRNIPFSFKRLASAVEEASLAAFGSFGQPIGSALAAAMQRMGNRWPRVGQRLAADWPDIGNKWQLGLAGRS
jgi:hypothetical protein